MVLLRILATFILLVFLSACSDSAAELDLPAYSLKYDPQRDPFADGEAALVLAKSTNRRVLIEVGGNWCGWCKAMNAFLRNNRELYQQFHATFVVVKVNYSNENRNEEFLAVFPKNKTYPQMYIANAEGDVLYEQNTAKFVIDGKYSVERFEEFIAEWQTKKEKA